MNVVQRSACVNFKKRSKTKNYLLRKDAYNEIRGILPISSYATNASRVTNKVPRYQFNNSKNDSATTNKSVMGPPLQPPTSHSMKRKLINSTTSLLESSSSDRTRARVLASDSAAVDTSTDFHTPKNRPTALRYISSSSRGGNRSARSTSTAAAYEASVILAISEGRGMARGEIGMAAVDLRHPHLVLCQFSDTLLYTHALSKINFFNPVEIIVPHTFCDGVQANQLYQLIKDQYPSVTVTAVQRRHFNDAAGRHQIQTLCAPQYAAVYLQVLQKFYALTAAAAVLKYVEYIQCIVYARESLKIEYHSSENTMIIDVGTATQLELVQPLVLSAGASCCLLGVLGPLYTIGGIRALRAAILQPSCNAEFINNRLDAVQDLIESEAGLMGDIEDVLKKLTDIDKILLLCMEPTNSNIDKLGEAQLNQTLLLKTTMDVVPNLVEALNGAQSGRLRKIKMDFENTHYSEIANRIRNIIQDDAHMEKGAMGSLQRCFAVKPNINGLLDVARKTYSELIEDIQKLVEHLSETYDLPIRLNQNMMKGFHVVLPIAPKKRRDFNEEDLPPIFIQIQKSGASVTMTTEELVVLDQQSKESLNDIQKMSNIVISSLLKELRPFMSSLYKLCENVAELDILVALAHASTIGSYIRPEFNEYMDIRNSVHPLLDYNSQVHPVPNDIFASPEHNFTIITGPNMAGKSIYIKQIALMQVMAQIGCFLPATNAVLRLCDRLFSRIGFNDSVELNASTYVVEIKEMQHIMSGLTNSSLIVVDELCRSTNEEEGTSMAWAICEELIASNAFTFFTTHFTYLTRLQDLYFCVVNMHAVVEEEERNDSTQPNDIRLVYRHKILVGSSKIQNYGLKLAATTNLPEDTVKLAYELSELITRNETPQQIRTPLEDDEATIYKFNAELKLEARKNQYAEEIVQQKTNQFKANNFALVERLRNITCNGKSDSSNKDSTTDITRERLSPLNISSRINSQDIDTNKMNQETIQSKSMNSSSNMGFNMPREKDVISSKDLLIDVSYMNRSLSNKYHSEIDDPIKELPNVTIADIPTMNNVSSLIDGVTTQSPQTHECNDQMEVLTYHDNNNNVSKTITDDIIECTNDCSTPKSINNSKYFGKNYTPKLIEIDCTANSTPISVDDNEHYTSDNNFRDENILSDSSSDIADAMTQVIEEYSIQDISMAANKSNDSRFLDEDFISEVINDINREIKEAPETIDVDNIILTPPLGFRDD